MSDVLSSSLMAAQVNLLWELWYNESWGYALARFVLVLVFSWLFFYAMFGLTKRSLRRIMPSALFSLVRVACYVFGVLLAFALAKHQINQELMARLMPSDFIWKWLNSEGFEYTLLRAALMVFGGMFAARLLVALSKRMLKDRLSPQANMLMGKIMWRLLVFISLLAGIKQFGLDLGAFLATAGIAGVAIGFAAQTSLSNIISGIFLVNERPYNLQDLIEVGGERGFVEEIGLLSLFLRTPDNRLIRIPNEMILKGSMTNITRYPIRRFDMPVGVAYDEDIQQVIEVLREVLSNNPLCLDEPEPLIAFDGFGESSLNFTVGAWTRTVDFIELKNRLAYDVKVAFDKHGIEIPFPHRTLAGGKASEPISIRVLRD